MSQIGWLKCVTRMVAAVVVLGVAAGIAAGQSNSAPVVTNVTLSQRIDGSRLVDIRFDLADADGNACDITVQASNDGGATWTVPTHAQSGHVGPGVTPGTGRQIVWDLLADFPGAAGSPLNVHVCADDGQGTLRSLTVTVTGSGTESVTSVPTGIDCPTDCRAEYVQATAVILTAYPGTNRKVTWGGADGQNCGNNLTCTISMSQARNVTATFGDNAAGTPVPFDVTTEIEQSDYTSSNFIDVINMSSQSHDFCIKSINKESDNSITIESLYEGNSNYYPQCVFIQTPPLPSPIAFCNASYPASTNLFKLNIPAGETGKMKVSVGRPFSSEVKANSPYTVTVDVCDERNTSEYNSKPVRFTFDPEDVCVGNDPC